MKRFLLWLALISGPTLGWFLFTDEGNKSWSGLVSSPTRQTDPGLIDVGAASQVLPSGGVILVPANPPATEPQLKVQIVNPRSANATRTLGVGLVVKDAQGRRSGADTFSDSVLQEIPDSSTERKTVSDNAGNQVEVIVVGIKPAAQIHYSIEITGKPGGEYRLAVRGVSPARHATTEIVEGRALADTTVQYQVNLANIRSLPFGGMAATVEKASDRFVSEPETHVRVSSYESLSEICERAYRVLSRAAGDAVEKASRFFADGKRYEGCAVTLSGSRKTMQDIWSPGQFYPNEGSAMYYRGWKADRQADGPDGTSFRIHNPQVFCLVSGSWDGGVDDDPSYVPSEAASVTVECAKVPEAGLPK